MVAKDPIILRKCKRSGCANTDAVDKAVPYWIQNAGAVENVIGANYGDLGS